jgi:hypothetical protein
MRAATLPEKPGLAATLRAPLPPAALALACLVAEGGVAAGCGSDHHVSPWGTRPDAALAAYVRAPDLDAELSRVDAETQALGLRMIDEIRAEPPTRAGRGTGVTVAIRGYAGRDAGGRAIHATRVATPRGVVLAVGPLDVGDLDRREPTELCPTVPPLDDGSGLVFRSGTDLNGDGSLDVVLRNDAGELAVWHVGELGSGAYPVSCAAPVTRGLDLDGDGRLDLWGQIPVDPADPIAPRLVDVATFAAGAYSNATAAARAWHAHAVRAVGAPPQPKQGAGPTSVSDAVRLRAALERAWHTILSGEPREQALSELRRESVPQPVRASFDRHASEIAAIPRR